VPPIPDIAVDTGDGDTPDYVSCCSLDLVGQLLRTMYTLVAVVHDDALVDTKGKDCAGSDSC